MFAQYFEYAIILGGRFFVDTLYTGIRSVRTAMRPNDVYNNALKRVKHYHCQQQEQRQVVKVI